AMAVFLSAVNVYMRDTQHLLEILLMAWFWGTPVVYQYELVDTKLIAHHLPGWLPLLNPITPVVLAFQRSLYGKASVVTSKPHVNPVTTIQLLPATGPLAYLWPLLIVIAVAGALYVGALAVFVRLEGNFAEEL
ncbi:MAG: hypothetical protein ACRDYD_13005, partial [Acidimicrobiales bacterium]